MTTTILSVWIMLLGSFFMSSTASAQEQHPCSSSNVTLLHWNGTDASFLNGIYPIYFPQLPTLQFLIDVDGAAQPLPNSDPSMNDTFKGTTFAMMYHVVKNQEDRHFYKTVYMMNSKLESNKIQKLMDCNINVTKAGIPYCDRVIMLPNTVVNQNSKRQHFLWSIIAGRQYGDQNTELGSKAVPYLYITDVTNYALQPDTPDAATNFPILINNFAKDPVYSSKSGNSIGFETFASANAVTSDIFYKPILMLDIMNPVSNQNELLVLHKSDANAIRILRLTPFHESFAVTSSLLLVPSIVGEGIGGTIYANNVKFLYSASRQQIHVYFTLFREQQSSFENFHNLGHNTNIQFPSQESVKFVNVLMTLDASSLDNLKVVKIAQLFTSTERTIDLFSNNKMKVWRINDMVLSGSNDQYLVLVGTTIFSEEGETDKNGFIYSVNMDEYQPFPTSKANAEQFSLVNIDDVQISNSEALTVSANFYGYNDTIAVGSIVRTKKDGAPFYEEPELSGYVHLYSASNLETPLGYKQMRPNHGIVRAFKVELYPSSQYEHEQNYEHIFLSWNIKEEGAVISPLSFSCTPKIVRDGWQYMLIGVFGGEFLFCFLIGAAYFAYKKLRAKFSKQSSAYESI
ncbi:hypothetical protein C9374_012959 [Naegleria lovaniensis]|uniref:Uncharacterized protein n=1 Tax=Naegleria lovaniensis TaxID=51637 RepID=A0AA88GAF8_NAELO|nr:uncharacterized protein C9374_012959 [Naegleria lovaniensis]KAG2373016.1 hypothetical protein C9374_012959 [Naegleria lovaniensis]